MLKYEVMKYLAFFDEIPSITLYDDLNQLLSVNDDGVIELTYIDIVKKCYKPDANPEDIQSFQHYFKQW